MTTKLSHTCLFQNAASHYTKGMFFDIFESLKIALGLFCMAQKLFNECPQVANQ